MRRRKPKNSKEYTLDGQSPKKKDKSEEMIGQEEKSEEKNFLFFPPHNFPLQKLWT